VRKKNPVLELISSTGFLEVFESEQKGKIYKKGDELVIFFYFPHYPKALFLKVSLQLKTNSVVIFL
jgi:hypothetical protein